MCIVICSVDGRRFAWGLGTGAASGMVVVTSAISVMVHPAQLSTGGGSTVGLRSITDSAELERPVQPLPWKFHLGHGHCHLLSPPGIHGSPQNTPAPWPHQLVLPGRRENSHSDVHGQPWGTCSLVLLGTHLCVSSFGSQNPGREEPHSQPPFSGGLTGREVSPPGPTVRSGRIRA